MKANYRKSSINLVRKEVNVSGKFEIQIQSCQDTEPCQC